jgi:hypothetical protein
MSSASAGDQSILAEAISSLRVLNACATSSA